MVLADPANSRQADERSKEISYANDGFMQTALLTLG